MADNNNNNIPDADEVTFHKKSALIGGLVGLFGGSVSLSIAVFFFPSLAGLLAVFAGSVCKPVESELVRYKEAATCCEARMAAEDYELCKSKLGAETE